jgi:PHD/YefM family antitoxin component YafN of YafNO toxin-antitoxin module
MELKILRSFDDTAHLKSSPINAKLLRRAIADADDGRMYPPPDL